MSSQSDRDESDLITHHVIIKMEPVKKKKRHSQSLLAFGQKIKQEDKDSDEIKIDDNNNQVILNNIKIEIKEEDKQEEARPGSVPPITPPKNKLGRPRSYTCADFRSPNKDDNLIARSGLFSREIAQMMFSCGDQKPYLESVKLLNDLVIDYITEITSHAMKIGNQGQIDVQDLLFLTRKDSKKCARIHELLEMNDELKAARRAFDVSELLICKKQNKDK